ncbi:MAG: type II toxin-antitoxin system VapB family antitoxin [Deferribacteraceae bacterium]|jgi:antitoxin VapB|nr:type II toxin-antitoxin system VapB family antitoxin [Deferribacteraceae bacterium]
MKNDKKIAKLFMNGRSQAIRLPKEFRIDGTEVSIQKFGNTLIIAPLSVEEEWDEFYARLDQMSEEIEEIERPTEHQEREALNDLD